MEGSSGNGFISGLLLALLEIGVVFAIVNFLHDDASMRGRIQHVENAGIGLTVLLILVVLVYGTQFAWEMADTAYSDHKELVSGSRTNNADLASKIQQLQGELASSQSDLEARKQMLHTSDPAFQNMTQTIRAFMIWRHAIGDAASCRVLVTSPDKEDGGLYMTFITFAVFGSNCPNGDLQNIGVRPENAEDETKKGMIPGMIVFHAPPDAKGANDLETALSNLFQVKRAYTLPGNAPENTIWLQFGPAVEWNTQRFQRAKNF